MTHLLLRSATLAVFSLLISCSGNSQNQKINSTETNISGDLQNPETVEKNSPEYKSAFENQTRVKGLKTKTAYEVQVINSNLGRPWGITNLPDGQFLITEKSGYLNVLSADGKTVTKIEGLPKVNDKGQGGLLDVVIDPMYENNKMIYFTFSEPANGGNHTAVGKGELSLDQKKILNPVVIFRATPTYDGDKHFGSRLAFDKSGNLYASFGERSDLETRPLAQNTMAYLGKIVKIDRDGKPAESNPFLKNIKFKPEIYSYGHRNPQGLAMDENGQLWEAEMGPKGGDEINLILAGKNYGWGNVTYGTEYSGKKIKGGTTQKSGTEQPVYYWDPSVSMSGITFYTGNIEEWKNNLFLGCLGGQKIIRLKIENNKVIAEEWLLSDKNERFRDVLNGKDGNLYAITDSGKLYKISKK
ncbi:PQQ-dependent sugar dehydrogenase [Halpernia frigidisoli]|uniref:Glucose/arabinose dehydrogenase, beta-propeller fold n=1 Tax=Halpernia frigidisoli TaxID=1125876 RepID=A0A1I3HLP8_9FLAO|nr:PQQ-dependent sugar dehydrogenase [Halpernia frigidisoli]SFI36666.1 Glucose/arabinose dehydrogenase, beta-propeller fold [Halpernia frigidisoli]